MTVVLIYLARFVAAGLLVCLFAVISEVCKPKRFAGLFGAAPSVLLAGVIITLLTKGAATATLTAEGAIAGAVGLICYALLAAPAIERYKALVGSVLALSGWFLVSFGSFVLLRAIMRW